MHTWPWDSAEDNQQSDEVEYEDRLEFGGIFCHSLCPAVANRDQGDSYDHHQRMLNGEESGSGIAHESGFEGDFSTDKVENDPNQKLDMD